MPSKKQNSTSHRDTNSRIGQGLRCRQPSFGSKSANITRAPSRIQSGDDV